MPLRWRKTGLARKRQAHGRRIGFASGLAPPPLTLVHQALRPIRGGLGRPDVSALLKSCRIRPPLVQLQPECEYARYADQQQHQCMDHQVSVLKPSPRHLG